ncbi:arsenic resistance N-acetyltransferase ArsN2 (plasmid) [Ralstonia pickettii]|uniref:arsenic resistance N-acetyltransferase ArsN2 n=1 Tax=Ralstonia TaxID=48736 RepID=UPI0027152D1A|nr:arsenic resistance N-acetyltransferase ArsN2 [Ralstonia pickettii]WKZ88718.1 arsenic resistance N-acetyltransferase ArsN2 [Ralstonia pickettii]
MDTLNFRPARPDDYLAIRLLLIEEGLPSEDVAIGQASRFHLAIQDDSLLACAGLELYGSDALLRSVAVDKRARRHGLGRILVDIAERDARATGAHRLFLLTTTAASYFEKLGYATVDRSAAPTLLQASTQFASLCPASAICLSKQV